MMKSRYLFLTLNGSDDLNLLFKEIGANFARSEETISAVDERYLDTFDWRIFKSGLVLKRNGTRYKLAPLAEMIPQEEISGPERERVFWWDFPEGQVRDRMESILSVRALSPLFRVVGQKRSLHLYNQDDKTVLRLSLDTGQILTDDEIGRAFSPLLHVAEVRGYRKPFDRVIELLKKKGLDEPAKRDSFLQLALEVIHRKPGDYSSKFSVALQPELTMNQAISVIGLQLHQTMESNLPGVLDDIDSEFLHDFRVAVRRTRSALSQLKKALPPGQRGLFSEEFKWLGSVTGAVRDIDVCLKKEAVFRELLPESMHRGLDLLLEEINRRRKGELLRMQKDLRSARTADLLVNWREFLLALPEDVQWPAGQVVCRKAAQKVVGRCFRRLLQYASSIMDGEDKDSAMHRLRIQGKKFRYLMEFFCSLFPEKATAKLLQEMKSLQDDLGDFNDLAVQIAKFQKDLPAMSKNPQVGDSLAGLIEGLDARKKRLRKRCLSRCKGFQGRAKKDLLDEILGKKTG
jgi:CHAD domain-containing protein